MAFVNRVRGGLFGESIRRVLPFYGTTIGRSLFGLTAAGVAFFLGSDLYLAAAIAVTAFLGFAIGPFSPFQAMLEMKDLLKMSLRGLLVTGFTGVAIAVLADPLNGIIFGLSGALMGPIYLLAIKQLPLVPLFNDNPATLDKNDTAEVLHGLIYGVMLVLTL